MTPEYAKMLGDSVDADDSEGSTYDEERDLGLIHDDFPRG